MKKLSYRNVFPFVILLLVVLCGCDESSHKDATSSASYLLWEARNAMFSADYNRARDLIDSIRTVYPKEFNVRKAAILVADSIELAEAKDSLYVADSLETFRTFQLEDTKKLFVFEKQERFQTVGYYVLPKHAGSKANLSFFPEVEETGKLLLVNIDANRRYTFTEVYLQEYDSVLRENLLKKISEEQRVGVNQCVRLATDFFMLKQAKELKERMNLKVRFFEKKISEDRKQQMAIENMQ